MAPSPAALAAGTPEIILHGGPPQMRPIAIPGPKRLAAAPEGAAPIVGSTPRAPFGILADPEDDSATVRHRALLVEAHRDALGKAALAAWRRRTQATAETFRHSGTRGWSGVADGRAAFLLVPPVPIRSAPSAPPGAPEGRRPRPRPPRGSALNPEERLARLDHGRRAQTSTVAALGLPPAGSDPDAPPTPRPPTFPFSTCRLAPPSRGQQSRPPAQRRDHPLPRLTLGACHGTPWPPASSAKKQHMQRLACEKKPFPRRS